MTPPARRAGGLGLLVVAVVLIGLTLRGPIVGVPPLLATIRADLGIGPATAGLVTSLPLLAFAVLSPVVSGLAGRLGVERTILLSMVLLGVAIVTRPWTGVSGLLVGTAAVGIAITIGNVVLPVLVRRDAGPHVPQVMAASVGAYGVGQTIAVYLAVPIAAVAGWRWSISVPGVLVVAALVVWAVRMRLTAQPAAASGPPAGPTRPLARGHVWRQGPAWWLAAFFGMQSLMFYTTSTWAPTQLMATTAMDELAAGAALSVFHLVGVLGTFLVPTLLRLAGDARRVGGAIAVGWLVYFTGLYLLPTGWGAWMTLGGLVQGAGIGLSLTFVAMRPIDAGYGRYLSGMTQSVGYGLAAVGPVVIGWVAEATAGWSIPTVMMLACAVLMAIASRPAGDPRPIGP